MSSSNESKIEEMDHFVKLFVTCIDHFGEEVQCKKIQERPHATKGNVLSLLGLKGDYQRFGPGRFLYDGNFERLVPDVITAMKGGLQKKIVKVSEDESNKLR